MHHLLIQLQASHLVCTLSHFRHAVLNYVHHRRGFILPDSLLSASGLTKPCIRPCVLPVTGNSALRDVRLGGLLGGAPGAGLGAS